MLDKCCISINARCNLHCKYCHFYENESLDMPRIASLSYEKLLVILNNILNYASKNHITKFSIGFAGGGEPLLDWGILSQALRAIREKDKDKRLYFYIITNGILLNEKLLNEYQEFMAYLHLVVSLDGDKNTHDNNRIMKSQDGYKGTHEKILQNLYLYKNIFGKMPAINLCVGRLALNNKHNIAAFFKEHEFYNLTFTRLFHCEDKTQEISQQEFIGFIQFFSQSCKQFIMRNLESQKCNKLDCIMYGNKCGVGYNNIFFFNDKVYPCMRFVESSSYILGDYTQSLHEIEANMTKLRKPIKECYYEEY